MTDKRFLAHIATEVVVVFAIVFFFFRQKQRLEQRVAALEEAVRALHEPDPVTYFPKQRRNAVVFAAATPAPAVVAPSVPKGIEVPFEELIAADIDDEIAEELSELQTVQESN